MDHLKTPVIRKTPSEGLDPSIILLDPPANITKIRAEMARESAIFGEKIPLLIFRLNYHTLWKFRATISME